MTRSRALAFGLGFFFLLGPPPAAAATLFLSTLGPGSSAPLANPSIVLAPAGSTTLHVYMIPLASDMKYSTVAVNLDAATAGVVASTSFSVATPDITVGGVDVGDRWDGTGGTLGSDPNLVTNMNGVAVLAAGIDPDNDGSMVFTDAGFDSTAGPAGAFYFGSVDVAATGSGATDLFLSVGSTKIVRVGDTTGSPVMVTFGAMDTAVSGGTTGATGTVADATITIIPEPATSLLCALLFGCALLVTSRHKCPPGRRIMRCSLLAITLTTLLAPANTLAIGLAFQQVDWLDGAGGFTAEDSEWGRVELALSAADDGLFFDQPAIAGRGGYVNVVTRETGGVGGGNWAVQNLPVFFHDPAELSAQIPEGVFFDLGSPRGTDVSSLDFLMEISETPLATMPGGVFDPAGVDPFDFLAGGAVYREFGEQISGSTGQAAPAAAENFEGLSVGNGVGVVVGATTNTATNVPPINEDVNGCAPGAVARSLQYMANIHPHINIPRTAQQTYGDLLGDMGTQLTGDNAGTQVPNIKSGKDAFVARHGLPIVTAQHWDLSKAIRTLNKGGDVEISFSWGNNDMGMSLGAHTAFVSNLRPIVTGAGDFAGFSVTVVDDPQGDGRAGNRSYRLTFAADGRLTGGSPGRGGRLINFQTQHVFRRARPRRMALQSPPTVEGVGSSVNVTATGGQGGPERLTENVTLTLANVIDPANPVAIAPRIQMNSVVDPTTETVVRTDVAAIDLGPSNPLPQQLLFDFQFDMQDADTALPIPLEDPTLDGSGPFLLSFWPGQSFFDITFHTDPDLAEGDKSVYRIHAEVDPNLAENLYFSNFNIQPQDPGAPASQFQFQFGLQSEAPIDFNTQLFSITQDSTALPDPVLGDLNGDGFVDGFDIDPFVLLLTNGLEAYLNAFPDHPFPLFVADFNDDQAVDGFDIDPFVTTLTAAGVPPGALAGLAIPEPATAGVFLLGLLGLVLLRKAHLRR